jgi:mannose/cellobiose epimerase-like protein (N-acyl-D-glucosamine 2-epimerase family)
MMRTATAHVRMALLAAFAVALMPWPVTALTAPAELREDVAALRASVFKFWACHGLDMPGYGGLHGTLSQAGAALPPDSKGLVQTARHMWAFSAFAAAGYHTAASVGVPGTCPGGSRPSSAAEIASSARKFMASALALPNGLYAWTASRDGKSILQPNTALYGQMFAVYGLAGFAAAFNDSSAGADAARTLAVLDRAWHNASTGGYNELESNAIPPTLSRSRASSSSSEATPGGRAASASAELPRTLNVLLHSLEATAALHAATGDKLARQRALQLLELVCVRLHRRRGLLFEVYAPPRAHERWQPLPESGLLVNYGHNLEAAWLIMDAVQHFAAVGALTAPLAARYEAAARAMAAAALRDGFDTQHGGVFESGTPHGGAASRVKVWWVQAESMLALWQLYAHGGSPLRLKQLARTAAFIRTYLDDSQKPGAPGEQVWQVEANGTRRIWGSSEKGNIWKASYHTGRSVLFLDRWMQQRSSARAHAAALLP